MIPSRPTLLPQYPRINQTANMHLKLISFVFVVGGLVGVARGGVGVLSAEAEAEAVRIYRAICQNYDEGRLGDTAVYCKTPKDPPIPVLSSRTVNLRGVQTQTKQLVFVRPQSHTYVHNIRINGNTEHRHNTSIFVVPQTDQHAIEIQDARTFTATAEKPHLFYLNSDPALGAPPPQNGSYLPPPKPGYVYKAPRAPLPVPLPNLEKPKKKEPEEDSTSTPPVVVYLSP